MNKSSQYLSCRRAYQCNLQLINNEAARLNTKVMYDLLSLRPATKQLRGYETVADNHSPLETIPVFATPISQQYDQLKNNECEPIALVISKNTTSLEHLGYTSALALSDAD